MRKTSQAALLVLLEQGLISKADMETKVCPVLLELTEPSSDDDYKIEAVAVRNLSYIFFQAKDLVKIEFNLNLLNQFIKNCHLQCPSSKFNVINIYNLLFLYCIT